MSTPYRIEYKGILSISDGYNGYPRDVLQEVIPYDLADIRDNKDKWITDIALKQDDYYARKIDNDYNYPAEYSYIVELNKNEEYAVTIYHNNTKVGMVNMAQISQMSSTEYDILMDELQYDCECINQKTKKMIESFGHKIYVKIKDNFNRI